MPPVRLANSSNLQLQQNTLLQCRHRLRALHRLSLPATILFLFQFPVHRSGSIISKHAPSIQYSLLKVNMKL